MVRDYAVHSDDYILQKHHPRHQYHQSSKQLYMHMTTKDNEGNESYNNYDEEKQLQCQVISLKEK